MSDERYYTVRASFDPAIFAELTMPWTPEAGAGQDPSDMRARRLTTARVGRFRPELLGRKAKSTSSLVQVWTDGPVGLADRYFVLGSDNPAESNPPSAQRGAAATLTTAPSSAELLELGPTDHLAIQTAEQTTCYIRVIDLDEEQLARWLRSKRVPPPGLTDATIQVENQVDDAVFDIPESNVDQLLVQVHATARTTLRLPPWVLSRPGQEVSFARNTDTDGLVRIEVSSGDLLNISSFPLYLPLQGGQVRLRRSSQVGAGGNWAGLATVVPRYTNVAAGNQAFLYGWPGLRIVRLLDNAAPQTLTLPSYLALNQIPPGCALRVANPTNITKTVSAAAAGELIVGLGAQALTVSVPAQTCRDIVYGDLTWTAL
ncbi:hypothetical protein OV203_01575 [Nannocystis sp. ILAH1]|uniref:hypothetical protein n=1 Tax=Nannocystis sp. ILAH1 TaxID=2996789 RepID=UPI00226DC3CD|nr:hypothetical protein [Nannocystis sp. ILAH1]MCY0985801.1 hypothetical protein [Nannocystis sp. ILAH1]